MMPQQNIHQYNSVFFTVYSSILATFAMNKQALGIAAAATVSVGALAYLLWPRSADEAGSTEPAVSKEQVLEAFQKINKAMSEITNQLTQIVKKLQSEGQSIPSEEIAKEFEKHVVEAQNAVLGDMKIDEYDLEDATDFFAEDAEVKQAVKTLETLYEKCLDKKAGQAPKLISLNEKMPLPELIGILNKYFDVSYNAVKKTVLDLKNEGKSLENPEVAAKVGASLGPLIEEETNKMFAEMGITSEIFEAQVASNQSNPQFVQAMTMLHQRQTQRLQALGIQPGL
mmetsp:Transcript_15335/g.22549  ORF Transcript_15335/g.22549 Transcript_15335/m.22549 type:complete len:284 (-) Transcript_15335:224-1075(-)